MGTPNIATVKAETAKPGSGDSKGIESNERSLTLQDAPKKSALEEAVEMEEALAKQGSEEVETTTTEGSDEPATEVETTEETTAETTTEETAEAETATKEATEEKGEAETTNADAEADDDVTFDKKGRAFVRKTRLEKILDKANKFDLVMEQLAQKALDPKGEKATEAKTQENTDPLAQIQERIKKSETDLEAAYDAIAKAKADYNGDAELAAMKARDKALRELSKAETDLVTENRSKKDSETNSRTKYQQVIADADTQHKVVRDELWDEDVDRIQKVDPEMDLNDPDSDFRQEVDRVVAQWKREGNPILLKPVAFRRAVELAADVLDIQLPAITPKTTKVVTTTAKPKVAAQPVKSNTVVHRKNTTAIANNSTGGKPQMTDQQILQQLDNLPALERLELLSKIQESQQKGK